MSGQTSEAGMEKEKAEENSEKRRGRGVIVLLLLLLLALMAVVAALLLRQANAPAPGPERPTYETEMAARLGQLEGKTEAEIQAELDRVIEEGMFNININTDPVFANGKAEGTLEIENAPSNLYLMRVEITREDTGELIYSTKYIEPNSHIQRAALDAALPAGDWPCAVTFFAYDMDTLTEMGRVSSLITIHVLN